jgi:hypothetical protein
VFAAVAVEIGEDGGEKGQPGAEIGGGGRGSEGWRRRI